MPWPNFFSSGAELDASYFAASRLQTSARVQIEPLCSMPLRPRFESTRQTTSRHSVWWREKSVKANNMVDTDVCCCKHVWADWRPWTYQVFVPNYSHLRAVSSAETPDNPDNLVACRLMVRRGPRMLPGIGQDSQLDNRAIEDDWLLSGHITAPWPATFALLSDLHDGSSKCLYSELGQYRVETCKVTVATRPAVLRTSCESRDGKSCGCCQ